jgi:fluoride ion exporter CrcB/FEX
MSASAILVGGYISKFADTYAKRESTPEIIAQIGCGTFCCNLTGGIVLAVCCFLEQDAAFPKLKRATWFGCLKGSFCGALSTFAGTATDFWGLWDGGEKKGAASCFFVHLAVSMLISLAVASFLSGELGLKQAG